MFRSVRSMSRDFFGEPESLQNHGWLLKSNRWQTLYWAALKMAISVGERSFARLADFPQLAVAPWIGITLASLRKANQAGRNPRSRLESP
jgi:hypothetical protein